MDRGICVLLVVVLYLFFLGCFYILIWNLLFLRKNFNDCCFLVIYFMYYIDNFLGEFCW